VDDHRIIIGVKNHDFQQAASTVSPDDQESITLGNRSELNSDSMSNIFVGYAVLAGTVGDLHHVKVPCQPSKRQDNLSSLPLPCQVEVRKDGWDRLQGKVAGSDIHPFLHTRLPRP
jgi:hypothetical protein